MLELLLHFTASVGFISIICHDQNNHDPYLTMASIIHCKKPEDWFRTNKQVFPPFHKIPNQK